jgi:hypothetical protein
MRRRVLSAGRRELREEKEIPTEMESADKENQWVRVLLPNSEFATFQISQNNATGLSRDAQAPMFRA